MKKLFLAAFAYLALGLGAGLYYRELTRSHDFTGQTQLGVAHTHLLTLGFVALLLVLVLDKVFGLSGSSRLFTWFFWTYNVGVVLSSAMMIWHGTLTVLGVESSKMIAGMAGLGHMFLSAGLVLLMLALYRRLSPATETAPRLAGARLTEPQEAR